MKKNKWIIILLIAIVLIIFLAFSPIISTIYKDKVRGEELEKIGSKNAISYIEEKYGFTPDIISVKAKKVDSGPIPVPAIQREYTGFVEVELKYNNKNFRVNISGEENSLEGEDTYQHEEIVSAILDMITQYKGDYDSYTLEVRGDTLAEGDTTYWDTYYNGSNIKDFLTPTITLYIYYVNNSNIEDSNNEIISLFEKGYLYLYNFKSKELLTEYQKEHTQFDFMPGDGRLANYADKSISIENGNIKTYNH